MVVDAMAAGTDLVIEVTAAGAALVIEITAAGAALVIKVAAAGVASSVNVAAVGAALVTEVTEVTVAGVGLAKNVAAGIALVKTVATGAALAETVVAGIARAEEAEFVRDTPAVTALRVGGLKYICPVVYVIACADAVSIVACALAGATALAVSYGDVRRPAALSPVFYRSEVFFFFQHTANSLPLFRVRGLLEITPAANLLDLLRTPRASSLAALGVTQNRNCGRLVLVVPLDQAWHRAYLRFLTCFTLGHPLWFPSLIKVSRYRDIRYHVDNLGYSLHRCNPGHEQMK